MPENKAYLDIAVLINPTKEIDLGLETPAEEQTEEEVEEEMEEEPMTETPEEDVPEKIEEEAIPEEDVPPGKDGSITIRPWIPPW